ncbi:MAG: membrane protein insertion efficiency factor YidD [Clostridia bacterium]|nr:membrane protein insertion efficiency factor YidD [Clostridia bacterium]
MLRVITFPISLICVLFIYLYRLILSPLIGNGCAFLPSCSRYGISAYLKFDFFRATRLTVKRLFRCNPTCKGEIDFLPLNLKGDYKWIC